jgi:hypothetical protein
MRKIIGIAMLMSTTACSLVRAEECDPLFGRSRCAPAPCPPNCQPYCPPGIQPGSPTNPNSPSMPSDQNAQNPSPFDQALASAGEGGTQPTASYAPGFFGDLIGSTILTVIGVPAGKPPSPFFNAVTILAPNVTSSGGIKVAESDSPRPTNRFYYNFNFYGGVTVSTDPSVPLMQVSRHEIGFEKTFFGGDASIGMRLPFFSFAGDSSFDSVFVGDLTIITKYAFINNRETGNVFSGGLVLTVPSGGTPEMITPQGTSAAVVRHYPVAIQPFIGFIYNLTPRLYLHNFDAVCVPTDPNEATFMSNDIGVGYWLFRDRSAQFIQGFIPTIEIHINTPFNHTAAPVDIGDVQMLDSTNITSGFNIVMQRATLGVAVGVPLVHGPEHIEAIANLTMHF